MKIELTEKEIAMLKQYSSVFEEERNIDATADPIVVVQRKEKVPTAEGFNVDGYWYKVSIGCYIGDKWYDVSAEGHETFNKRNDVQASIYEAFNELGDMISDRIIVSNILYEISDILAYGEGLEREVNFEIDDVLVQGQISIVPYTFVWTNVAYFFTRAEAEHYTKYQAHNLEECRVYTLYAGYRNQGDFPVFQKLLLRMGDQLCAEDAS